jgi:hypothetical protein
MLVHICINTIVWENGTTPIAKELILAKVAELQAEYEANQYQRDRAKVISYNTRTIRYAILG